MRAAGGNLFSFICCVVGIYASGMQPGSGTSVVRTEMNRAALAAGYFTNMWPENTPRAQPPSIQRFRPAASVFPFSSTIFDFEDFYIFRPYSIQFDYFIMVDISKKCIGNANCKHKNQNEKLLLFHLLTKVKAVIYVYKYIYIFFSNL